ncbi:MAG: hypothetical protein KHX49_03390 [Lachnospiraceae bacterium]|nr:hypothetical protein [Lachnospiraceae bacterium]
MNQWKRKLTAVGMGALIGLVWGCTIWSRAEEDPAVRKEAGQQEQSDQEQQARILYEAVSQEKLEEYLDEHPEGSCEDERASFRINETLNEAAAHRLLAAMESGYTDGRIPGEGTVEEYLESLPRPSSRTCMELYLRSCEDGQEAYEKFEEKMMERYEKKEDRKYLPEYYREIGMAQAKRDGKYDFLMILMR